MKSLYSAKLSSGCFISGAVGGERGEREAGGFSCCTMEYTFLFCRGSRGESGAVSYTHLTLPTKRIV